jgi:hypothetical protein
MSWAKTFLIASHEFFARIKSPVFYILTLNPFVGYMLIGLLFGLMFAGASENLELPVGLMDHSGLLSMLPSKEKEDENFLIYSSMEEAQAALRDRRVRALVEIPRIIWRAVRSSSGFTEAPPGLPRFWFLTRLNPS